MKCEANTGRKNNSQPKPFVLRTIRPSGKQVSCSEEEEPKSLVSPHHYWLTFSANESTPRGQTNTCAAYKYSHHAHQDTLPPV